MKNCKSSSPTCQVESQRKSKKAFNLANSRSDISICNESCVASGACFHPKKMSRVIGTPVIKQRLNPAIEANPVKAILKLKKKSPNKYKALNQFLFDGFVTGLREFTHSDTEFGYKINLSRTRANRARNDLVADGIVYKKCQSAAGRRVNSGETCTYELNPFFKSPAIRKLLRTIFPFMMIVHVTLLPGSFSAQNMSSFSAQNKGRTQYNENFLYIKNSLFNNSDPAQLLNKKEEEPSNGTVQSLESDNVPRSCSMSQETIVIIPVVESLKSLELTVHGQAELAPFPEEALLFADARLAKALLAGASVASPLGYMISAAKAWCKERSVAPEYHKTSQMIREHSISLSAPKIVRIKLSKAEAGRDNSQTKRRAAATDWKAKLEADAKPYHDEQAALHTLTKQDKLDRIRPGIEAFKQASPALQELLIKLHPFPDAKELIAELLSGVVIQEEPVLTERVFTDEERQAVFNLAAHMTSYPLERQRQSLINYGMEEYLPLLEEYIALTPHEDDGVFEEVYD